LITELTVDLESQEVVISKERRLHFEIDPFRKNCLLQGLDDIGLTLEKKQLIKDYEAKQKKISPWLFEDVVA